ncbi:serine hydrolase [Erythrobacter sp. F6033]|uniref:serine hydrolase n=1 Tax=Erythrobacter sp. F6033 TaxID=2926401 RepID=UPI001FF66E72|nr:serine hydrolase [Erythrobacter sp. F6033]MCK0128404.1 serine hydrolase [Erythrobacter sp. F6033]
MKPLKSVSTALALLLTFAFAPTTPLAAQDGAAPDQAELAPIQMRSEQVIALLNGELDVPLEEIFTDGFLQAVPEAQLKGLSTQLTTQFGRAVSVEKLAPPAGIRSALAIRMERAIGRGGIAIDPNDDNRISELLFRSFDPIDDSVEKITADLNALPGKVGVYFGPIDGENPIIGVNTDDQFAIGSTFKVYVLAALNRRIKSGEEFWDTTTDLSIARRSFPSGMMQDWPNPAPVTLQTLATMMISISDNTATDALMRHVGVDAVIDEMIASGHSQPQRNVPFLTTREMFALKAAGDETLTRFRAAPVSEKAEILRQLNDSDLDVNLVQSAFSGGPVALDVEWFASPNDLRKLYVHMLDQGSDVPLKVMSVNPSMADNGWQNWSRAHYKGGSEPGVLNLTWLLYNRAGFPYVLTLSWNNPDANVDETALELLAQRIMALPL